MLNIIAGSLSVGVTPSTSSYESIATVTVGSGGTSTITFSSISSDYEHLQIRGIARTNFSSGGGGDYIKLRFNSDSGANYTSHILNGDGSTTQHFGVTGQNEIWAQRFAGSDASSGIFGGAVIDILDYKNTNKYKTMRNLGGVDQNGSGRMYFNSGLWLNTSAITTITLLPGSGSSFDQYSHFALYGIKGS